MGDTTELGSLPFDIGPMGPRRNALASDSTLLLKSEPISKRKASEGARTETLVFWLFIAGLAWVPFLYGSNVLLAWSINAILFPGLAITYEVSLIVRRKGHPVAIKEIWVSAILFALVVAWIVTQNATWTPESGNTPFGL